MKVALLHDYLNQLGGGERVLDILMEMFPEASVYTLLHDAEKTLNRYSGRVKETSFLDLPIARNNHRLFIPLMPMASNTMTVDDDYDLVISDSAGYAKGFRVKPTANNQQPTVKTVHISYIHTPLRYAWELDDYIGIKYKVLSIKYQAVSIRKIISFFVKPIESYLRRWDYKAAQKPDVLIANSKFIAEKIKKYYNRDAEVIYPPVDTQTFYHDHNYDNDKKYHLAVGRLMHYKRFDLVIEAFAKLGFPLRIVGSGPEEMKLRRLAHRLKAHNIRFLSNASDDDLRRLYNGAKALIFPQVEDFGLVAAEAQACGCPVIAYAAGGALEIVKNKKTGLFFDEQTSDIIAAAVTKFSETKLLDRAAISTHAQKFSKENFKKEIFRVIGRLAET